MSRFDPQELDEIRHRIGLPDLAARLGIELKRKGREYLGLCPFHNERTPSFTIVPGKFYHCFGCGSHGDAVGLVMRMKGIDFPEAVAMLAEESGVALGRLGAAEKDRARERAKAEAEAATAERAQATEDAREIWRSCRPAEGSLVEDYLRSRAIEPEALGGVPRSLRFHPALRLAKGDYRPAMVAAVQAPADPIVAVHRTFLRADGKGKAEIERPKRMFGPVWQGAVRFGPATPEMRIAEGIETSLSVLVVTLLEGRSVWAALSLGNMAGSGDEDYLGDAHPSRPGHRLPVTVPDMERPGLILPELCRAVTLCVDMDNKDPWASEALIARAYARYRAEGLRVDIARPPAGMDFNDLLRRGQARPQVSA
jgi:DNA primase